MDVLALAHLVLAPGVHLLPALPLVLDVVHVQMSTVSFILIIVLNRVIFLSPGHIPFIFILDG